MSKIATSEYDDKTNEVHTVTGSESEIAVNISKLCDQSGLIIMDAVYKNSGVCLTEITFLDDEESIWLGHQKRRLLMLTPPLYTLRHIVRREVV